jgi:hypothetical protein
MGAGMYYRAFFQVFIRLKPDRMASGKDKITDYPQSRWFDETPSMGASKTGQIKHANPFTTI